jgi:glycosyltransferase involved in cell wall biosynthesis
MRKRVLFVFHESNPLSGATASMLEVVIKLKERDFYDIVVLIPDARLGLHKVLDNIGINYIEESYCNIRHTVSKKRFFLRKLNSFFKILTNVYVAIKLSVKSEKFDLIYTNTSDNYIGAFTSRIMGLKHIWHIREFGLEDQNASHFLGEKIFFQFVNNTSCKVIVISKALKEKMEKFNVFEDKLEMIYNDVSSRPEKLTRSYGLSKTLSLLIVGTISEGKGHKFILDCVEHMKSINLNVKLGVLGDDKVEYASYLKTVCKEIDCEDRVEFLGYCTNAEEVRASYDVAIIASKSEAFGRVTVEAMHSGMVVVASDCGANPELIKSGENGFLFEYGNIDEFVKAISFLNTNRDILETIGRKARISSTKFSSGDAANKINHLICNELKIHDQVNRDL